MKSALRWFSTFLFLALVLCCEAAHAQCGGFCIYEVGTPQMGSSYAGAGATAQDAATAFLNPAGMTRLNGFNSLVGLVGWGVNTELDLDADTQSIPPGETDGGGELGGFFAFGAGYSVIEPPRELPLSDLRFGFTFNNLYGGDLSYDANWVGRTFVTDIRFYGINLEPSLAYRFAEWFSFGAGLHVLYYHLNYDFRSGSEPTAATVNVRGAKDWTVGFSLGALLEPRDDTRIGVVYRHDFDVTLTGDGSSVTSIGTVDVPFRATFELPRGVNVSVAHELTPAWVLLADAGWTDWSVFSGQEATIGGMTLPRLRDWRDTWRVAGGVQHPLADWILTQAGISYDSSPVSASNRLPDIPAGENYRFSAGSQWNVRHDRDATVTLGLTYTFLLVAEDDVNQVGLPSGVILNGEYAPNFANIFSLTLAASFR